MDAYTVPQRACGVPMRQVAKQEQTTYTEAARALAAALMAQATTSPSKTMRKLRQRAIWTDVRKKKNGSTDQRKSVEPFAHIWDWNGQHLPAALHRAVK